MKTTIDLPDELVKEVKLQAVRDGRKLKDAVADLIRKGLRFDETTSHPRPAIVKNSITGLPTVLCTAPATSELTPDRVAEILIEQVAIWRVDAR